MTNKTEDQIPGSDLIKEDTLGQMFAASLRMRSSWFDYSLALFFGSLGAIYTLLADAPIEKKIEWLRGLAETGIGFATSILGFLIAGFAMFAAVRSPRMVFRMATVREPQSGLSFLKANYYALLQTFVYYLCFDGFCIVLKILGSVQGVASTDARFLQSTFDLKWFLVVIGGTVTCAGFGWMFASLKSFIRNVVHIVMTGHTFEVEAEQERIRKEGGQ